MRNSGTGALTEHWDGRAWTAVLGPDARFQDEVLNGVDDIAPSDAWAVGRVKQSGYSGGSPLILHWNGSSWQTIPPPGGVTGELRAVTRDWAGGAWAVGDDGHGHPLALRCSVTICAVVSVPQVGSVGRLRGIKAFAQDDVWAAGDSGNMTLVVHWDGAGWSVVPSPNPDPFVNVLYSVGGVASNDLWAVGHQSRNRADTGVPPGTRTLAMHWNGMNWSPVDTPNVGDNNSLSGVTATGPAAVTAVGTFEDVSGGGAVARTLGARWNGSNWATLATPNVGTADNLLRAVAPIPGTADVWAVGMHLTTGGPSQTLVLRGSEGAPMGGASPPDRGPAPSSEATLSSDAAPPSEAAPPSDAAPSSGPAPSSGSTPTSEPTPPSAACGPIRITLPLGKAGLRARRITVNAGGRKQVLLGPRRRLKVKVPYTGADYAQLTVRIRMRDGKLRTIRRTVNLCRQTP
jgi:hypothetical protein